jgi:pimeloyl-ACP methyl ester carboxylesterase
MSSKTLKTNTVAFLLLLVAAGWSVRSQSAQTSKIGLQPCEVPGAKPDTKEKVLCSKFEVFEDRAAKRGRKISINIVVFPATGQDKAPDPLFYIPGGPGSSATEDAPFVAEGFAKIREHRDLVFVDQRGTGGSNPLNCELFDTKDPQSLLGHWNPPDQVRKCRTELEARADLKLYTTTIAMDDLDEVRAGLDYDKINIIGGSYGTRATQEYVRRHGKHVRAIILHGVSLTGQFMPRDFPQDTERAINGVLEECAADQQCRNTFPNLQADKKKVLDHLLSGPIEVDVKFPEDSDKTTRVRISRDLAAEAVRYMLYQSGGASRLPLFLHSAAEGNFTPLAQAALFYRQNLVGSGATGMYLSVTCAEDLPWIKPGVGEHNGENTFLGDYRLRQQREACAEWPRGEIPRDYSSLVRSNVPALILTGQWDPVTPPVYAETVAKGLLNSLNIVVPSGGHGFNGLEGLDCVDNLITDFVARGTVKGVDPSCVKSIHRKGFQLKFEEPAK